MAALSRAPSDVVPSTAVDWALAERPRPGNAESDAVVPVLSPQKLADGILARHGRDTDDALVLVARLQGAAG